MEGKCYYCNQELTERTIEKHIKSCSVMKKRIEGDITKNDDTRKQFIIAIKLKHDKDGYCIYLSIDSTLGLVNIDQFLRDVCVKSCGCLSGFTIRKRFYQDNEMNARLNDILTAKEKFEYQYDLDGIKYLDLEILDVIDVPKDFTQIEIIARNNKIKNYDSSRDCFYHCEGYEEVENKYLPNNDKRYKTCKHKEKKQDDYESILDSDDAFFDELSNMEDVSEELLSKRKNIINNMFYKGIYSFDIKELVNNLAKNNIYDIARYLGMTKISSLNKNDLIEKLLDEYEVLIEERLSLFDEERYKFLKSYADNGGTKLLDKIDEDNIGKMVYFMANGMLFSSVKDGEPILLMPEFVQNLIKEKNNIEYRNIVKFNTEIINLYRGMNKAYGILKLEDIKELFKRYEIEESERYRIEDVIVASEDYYQEYESDTKGTLFVNIDVEDRLDFLEQLEEELDYARIPKKELLSMSEKNWISKTKFGRTFTKEFLSMFNVDEEILEGLIESLYLEIQENECEEVINEMLEQLEEDSREAEDFICNSLSRFLRNIRLWKYRGATINEKKGELISKEKQKAVGRNEKCTCGSGKKYKNCCAKNGNVIKLF